MATSTNYTSTTPNTITYAKSGPISTTIAVGTPIGLLLMLTYAAAQTILSQASTNFTASSINSTNYTSV